MTVLACRNALHVDGSLQDFLYNECSPLLLQNGQAVVFDYSQDSELAAGRLDFLKIRDESTIRQMIDLVILRTLT